MTSGISFLKNYREYIRHHMAEPLLVIFCSFFHLLGFVIYLQNIISSYSGAKRGEIPQVLTEAMSPSLAILILAGLLGALIGMTSFSWLHSREKSDFYHALPLRRSNLYWLTVLSMIVTFFVPMAAGFFLECVIVTAAGYGSSQIWIAAVLSILAYTLSFLLGYLTEALAMILTGKLVTGFLGGCVFALYAPFLRHMVLSPYASTFFRFWKDDMDSGILNLFSPLSLVILLPGKRQAGAGKTLADQFMSAFEPFYLAAVLFWILVLLALTLCLFRIRKAEMAGNAMAFSIIKLPLKLALVVPASLFTGWGLYQLTLKDSKVWMTAGILIGAILFHGLIEAIFQMDPRGLWTHKRHLAAAALLALGAALVFRLDLLGYDTWLPDRDKLSEVVVRDEQLFPEQVDLPESASPAAGGGADPSGLKGRDAEVVLEFLKDYLESEDWKKIRDEDGKNGSDENLSAEEEIRRLQVTFRMKNGKVRKRVYPIPVKKYGSQMDAFYAMDQFKKDNCLLYHLKNPASSLEITVDIDQEDIPYGTNTLYFTPEETASFMEAYLADYQDLTFSEMETSAPTGLLYCTLKGEVPTDYVNTSFNGYIYPSFHRTIQWLSDNKKPEPELGSGTQVFRLDVSCYREGANQLDLDTAITDPALIAEILPTLLPADLVDKALAARPDSGLCQDMDIVASYRRGNREWQVTMRTDQETAERIIAMVKDEKQ